MKGSYVPRKKDAGHEVRRSTNPYESAYDTPVTHVPCDTKLQLGERNTQSIRLSFLDTLDDEIEGHGKHGV